MACRTFFIVVLFGGGSWPYWKILLFSSFFNPSLVIILSFLIPYSPPTSFLWLLVLIRYLQDWAESVQNTEALGGYFIQWKMTFGGRRPSVVTPPLDSHSKKGGPKNNDEPSACTHSIAYFVVRCALCGILFSCLTLKLNTKVGLNHTTPPPNPHRTTRNFQTTSR